MRPTFWANQLAANSAPLPSPIHDGIMTWKNFKHYWPFVRGTTGYKWFVFTKRRYAEICVSFVATVWTSCWINSGVDSPMALQCSEIIISARASQITGASIVYPTICSGVDQGKHQSSASLAFVGGISPVTDESPIEKTSNTENISICWRHHCGHYLISPATLLYGQMMFDYIHYLFATRRHQPWHLMDETNISTRHSSFIESVAYGHKRQTVTVYASHGDNMPLLYEF